MNRVLLITVRFHDGRYHGTGDWPPSPARLFQAIVAGVGQSGPLDDETSAPLYWLETLAPPMIAAPHMVETKAVTNYVPNNDLDTVGGDARRIASIRTAKPWKAKLFPQEEAFLYAWDLNQDDSGSKAQQICDFAEKLYQLGRGVDLAWAVGEIVSLQEFEKRLLEYPGIIFRPSMGRSSTILNCPGKDSLNSLKLRHAAMGERFRVQGSGRKVKVQFVQAPKPRFVPTAYDSPPTQMVFELCSPQIESGKIAWPHSRTSALVVAVRDVAVASLKAALPEQEPIIEKCLVGRKANGDDDAPKSFRIRILPLPSIGHQHTDPAIRRILVEVPSQCPVRTDDIFWAFSGLEVSDCGVGAECILIPSNDDQMLRHYGLTGQNSVRWHTITPAVLPQVASRRRIEPTRRSTDAKGGIERGEEQQRAAHEVIQALRHAEIPAPVKSVRVQREPFETKGLCAEDFASGTRFSKRRFWHVELIFEEALTGPLIIGDGRYYGLGLMAPTRDPR